MGGLAAMSRSLAAPSIKSSTGVQTQGGFLPLLGATRSATGIAITQASSMTEATIHACIMIRSSDVARCTPALRKEGEARSAQPVTDHPVAKLFKRPNWIQTWFEFAQQMHCAFLLRKNAYAAILRNGRGQPYALIPINPDAVQVLEASNGQVFYLVNRVGLFQMFALAGLPVAIPAEDMLHLRGLSFNMLFGVPTIELAKDSIGLSLGLGQQAARLIGNGARPGGVLETAKQLSDAAAQRLQAQWERMREGLENVGRTAILEEGLTWKAMQLSSVDQQFIEQRKLSVEEGARWMGVPLYKLSVSNELARIKVDDAEQVYVNTTVMPDVEAWEQKIEQTFDLDKQKLVADLDERKLIRASEAVRVNNQRLRIMSGISTQNECRAENGDPPMEGGNVLLHPVNLAASGSDMNGTAADGAGRPSGGKLPDPGAANQAPAEEDSGVMELKRKYLAGAVIDDATLGDRQIRVIVSTPDPDRVKDIMEPAGCELENFKLNPIFLADHNPKTPIGTIDIEVKADHVEGVVTFAPLGASAKADEYCALFKAKILNTVSPGFRELEVEPLPGGGVRIKRWELLEVSGVAVPANPKAVVTARAFKADSNWKVGASRNLPIGEGDDWDGDAAAAGIFDHADFDGDDPDTTFARKGFLVYDAANPEDRGSYKLPFAHVVDGRLTAMPEGIRNAASRLPQTDIPDDVAEKARAVIDHYEGEMSKDKSATAIKTKEIGFFKTKDLYDASMLANVVQSLVSLASWADYERDLEGDASQLPEMLAQIARDAGAALIAMTNEEVDELIARLSGLTTEQKSFIAAGTTPVIKAFRAVSIETKAGRKFSAATQKSMEDACKNILAGHDAIKALFGDPNSDDDPSEDEAETDTEKALPADVMSDRAREIELLRLKSC